MSDYTQKSSLALLAHFISIYPLRFLVVLIALLIAGVVETIGIGALLPLLNVVLDMSGTQEPSVLTHIMDTIFGLLGIEQNFQNLLLIIVVTISLKAFVIFQALKIVSYIAVDITYDLRQKFIGSLMGAKWSYYSGLDIGESANAIATESDYAGQFCAIMGKTLSASIQACIYTLIAFSVDWKISLAAIVMGALAAFILKFIVRMARDAGNVMAETLNNLLSRLNASLSGAKPIKAMGEEGRYIDLLKADTLDLQTARKKFTLSALLLNLIHEPLLVLLMAIGLFWAYNFADYPMSELFMMAFLFNRLLSQVNMVQNHYQKTAIFEGAVNGILKKIQLATQQVEKMSGTEIPVLDKEIKFKDLSLAYGEDVILHQLSEKIPAHKMTVVFGPSGSGKSTLLDATLGLLPPDKGQIYIDDVSLETLDIQKWRRMIGYVPQENFLFNESIATNVTLGDQTIKDTDIIEALKTANAWEFVQELEEGIHYNVGERGGKLSGGQRQRIALARALVRKPSLLILDEATSGLDQENDQAIMSALKAMLPEITIILISHDPKILERADYVIRLDK